MRRFFLLIFEGPRKPWWLTPLIVAAYPAMWFLTFSYVRNGWVWLVPWLLLLWWQVQRFAVVAHYEQVSKRELDWTCPTCQYPLAKLTKNVDPRTVRCPECGTIPQQVKDDAKEKLRKAGEW